LQFEMTKKCGIPKLDLDSQGRVQYKGDKDHPSLQSLLDDKDVSGKLFGVTGGFQATQGGIYLGPLSFPYAVGSMLDLLHEGFAGPHDVIAGQAPGHYDEKGNTSRGRTPEEEKAIDAWAVVAILPATPFSISALVSPDLLEMIFKVAQ
jgi:filamentous hemagglutinin